ncbi:MAG TPA: hypothetical protein PLU88_13405 [Armatimonadota bacterium]|nr:hypothetical protein [Armatimonadota bacterium]
MEKIAQYIRIGDAPILLKRMATDIGSQEIAVVKNLDYIYAPLELYLLTPKVTKPLDRIAAFAVDMDGTSTTTEPLALHALEYMVRRFTGRLTKEEWTGLDPIMDYPFVIGNSNFRHTEFLINRYAPNLKEDALRASFFESLLWTLSNMEDKQRLKDIRQNAINCGIGSLLDDAEFNRLVEQKCVNEDNVAQVASSFQNKYGRLFSYSNQSELVSAALDIYYTRYHSILRRVQQGDGAQLSKELLGEGGRRLIEPMPGYAVFIALIKGWIDDEAAQLYDVLVNPSSPTYLPLEQESRGRLVNLARRFQANPAKLGLVTASIAFEAHTVVHEVFKVMQEQIQDWPVSKSKRSELIQRFDDYLAVYDGFVTASDSSEARLKPHRDLYNISLYQMSIPKEDYSRCIGVEDTEPGIISLRAAGIGCAVALPNHDTSRQNYEAASHILHGGLPEMILKHNLFLAEN